MTLHNSSESTYHISYKSNNPYNSYEQCTMIVFYPDHQRKTLKQNISHKRNNNLCKYDKAIS